MKVLSLHWVDSISCPSWQSDKSRRKPFRCHSVGFLVHENDQIITLALSRAFKPSASNDKYCDTITIPKAAITKRKTVKL